MLLRRVARPLLATWFIASGLGALRRPTDHVDALRQAADRLTARLPLAGRALGPVTDLSDTQLTAGVRLHGTAILLAGLGLATGSMPRATGAALVVLTAPRAVANLPGTAKDKEDARRRRDRLVQIVSMTGAAMLVAADLEGRPGLRWKMRARRQSRAERAATSS